MKSLYEIYVKANVNYACSCGRSLLATVFLTQAGGLLWMRSGLSATHPPVPSVSTHSQGMPPYWHTVHPDHGTPQVDTWYVCIVSQRIGGGRGQEPAGVEVGDVSVVEGLAGILTCDTNDFSSLSDSHSLRYYYTAVSSPGSGLPVYSEVGYLDDREITNYNSDTRQEQPKTEWMKKLGSDYWEHNTQIGRNNEAVSKRDVQTLMKRYNQTGGIHIVQLMSGCELRDDGTTDGYDQHRYDGREFMYLDTQSALYIPTMNEAQITSQRWNSPEMRVGERKKNYLENICIEGLKKHINNGREDLEKRVRPEVKVWGRPQSDDVMRLQCLVYGFHPRAVDVKWVRNGVDDVPSDEMSPILPHPDGTYQIRVSAEVPAREGDTYSCHVDHSSLQETLSVIWEPDNGSSMTLIIAIVCAVVAVIAIAVGVGVGVFFYKKRGGGYKTTSTSDTNSESSNNANSPNNANA